MDKKTVFLQTPPAGWHSRMGTLATDLHVQGRGLHTGRKAAIRITPPSMAEPFEGIVFKRKKGNETLARAAVLPHLWKESLLCSSLALDNGMAVMTVEHLLAALLMCEIDAAVVEIDAEEVPFLDASAAKWVKLITACGRVDLPRPKRFVKVLKEFSIRFEKARYHIAPADAYVLHGDTHERDLKRMRLRTTLTPEVFARELAAARSFGHVRRVFPALLANVFMKQPLLRGVFHAPGALIANGRVVGGMRLPNEMVRHRMLDFIGDFAFLGAPVLGFLEVRKPSHKWNHRFLQAFLAEKDSWCWASVAE